MSFDDNFFKSRPAETRSALSKTGCGILRVVLLFGSAAIALALLIVPVLNDQANRVASQSVLPNGIDRTMTGSIKRDAHTKTPATTKCNTSINQQSGKGC